MAYIRHKGASTAVGFIRRSPRQKQFGVLLAKPLQQAGRKIRGEGRDTERREDGQRHGKGPIEQGRVE